MIDSSSRVHRAEGTQCAECQPGIYTLQVSRRVCDLPLRVDKRTQGDPEAFAHATVDLGVPTWAFPWRQIQCVRGNPEHSVEDPELSVEEFVFSCNSQSIHQSLHKNTRYSADVGRLNLECHQSNILKPTKTVNRSGARVHHLVVNTPNRL